MARPASSALLPPVRPTAREIFVDHAAFVLRIVRRLGVAPSDVEDVAQEVFVIVHRKIDTYDGSSAVRTWLFGIASRVVSDHRRRAHRRYERLTHDLPVTAMEATQPADARARELRSQLDSALSSLDDAKRAVFVLHDMEEMTMPEVAEAVGCPLNTAYSRLREARQRVRAFFEQRVQEDRK
jgi:RNA polymerase sigma-70 factor (ECF subfamily)